MAKPTVIPFWATGGTIVDPGAVKKALGWVVEDPPYEFFNYLHNAAGQWITYLDTILESPGTGLRVQAPTSSAGDLELRAGSRINNNADEPGGNIVLYAGGTTGDEGTKVSIGAAIAGVPGVTQHSATDFIVCDGTIGNNNVVISQDLVLAEDFSQLAGKLTSLGITTVQGTLLVQGASATVQGTFAAQTTSTFTGVAAFTATPTLANGINTDRASEITVANGVIYSVNGYPRIKTADSTAGVNHTIGVVNRNTTALGASTTVTVAATPITTALAAVSGAAIVASTTGIRIRGVLFTHVAIGAPGIATFGIQIVGGTTQTFTVASPALILNNWLQIAFEMQVSSGTYSIAYELTSATGAAGATVTRTVNPNFNAATSGHLITNNTAAGLTINAIFTTAVGATLSHDIKTVIVY